MSEEKQLLSQTYVKIDGADAPDEFMDAVHEITVESSLHLPDVATIILHDTGLDWVDDPRLAPGTELEISADAGEGDGILFQGEIVEFEPEFTADTMRLAVRAFDRLHRLARGRHVRSFQNVTHGDLVQKIAEEVGLQAEVAATSVVHEYVFQNNETNLEFLSRRSAWLGYLLFVRDRTLHCEPPKSNGHVVDVEWGVNLSEFRPRLTTVGQMESVTVRGWDPWNRQEIIGLAENGSGVPEVGESDEGGKLAREEFNLPASRLVAERPIRSQAEADQLAKAEADRIAGTFIQAEGVCGGDPEILAGASVNVSAVGDRFSGTYFVTSSRHDHSPERGYSTEFSVSGHQPQTLLTALLPQSTDVRKQGLVVGIVTDNLDPQGYGRVKVRFPWLTDEHASEWARVAAPGGGPDRGLQFLPEVNDEVLVGFEQGDIHHPYVIGGLWNGQDLPPKPSDEAVRSGRVDQRIVRTRTGHFLLFDDSDRGGITIEDRNGNRVHLDSSGNNLRIDISGDSTLSTSGNLTLEAQGQVRLRGNAGVSVESSGQVEVTGAVVKLN